MLFVSFVMLRLTLMPKAREVFTEHIIDAKGRLAMDLPAYS